MSKINQDSQVIIVGGGIAGLFSASFLLSKGINNVTIIEKDNKLGGLLSSAHYQNPLSDGTGYDFDFGTHFVLKTGNSDVDAIIDADLDDENYYEYCDSLPEGQYLNGVLYLGSGCANATLLSGDVLEDIKKELAEIIAQDNGPEPQNLHDVLINKYGETAVKHIYEPAFQKFTGCDLEELDKLSENSFNSSRLIIDDRAESIALKKDPQWDDLIAFAHYKDGHSSIKKYYPKEGGIGSWITAMEERLRAKGVVFLKSSEITSVSVSGGDVQTIHVKDQSPISCDFLIWTIPPIFLAKSLNIEVPSMPPIIRSVSVVNLIVDQKPVPEAYWITIYDPDMKSYRVTLYNNFTEETDNGRYKISVEILHSRDFEGDRKDQDAIFEELKKMSIIPNTSHLLWSGHEFIPAGFPVLKPGDKDIYDQQIAKIYEVIDNTYIVSRFRGAAQGQMAIMQNIFEDINAIID